MIKKQNQIIDRLIPMFEQNNNLISELKLEMKDMHGFNGWQPLNYEFDVAIDGFPEFLWMNKDDYMQLVKCKINESPHFSSKSLNTEFNSDKKLDKLNII